MDIGDGEEVPAGIGPEPVSEGEKETAAKAPENIETEDMQRLADIRQRKDIQQGEGSQQQEHIEQQEGQKQPATGGTPLRERYYTAKRY